MSIFLPHEARARARHRQGSRREWGAPSCLKTIVRGRVRIVVKWFYLFCERFCLREILFKIFENMTILPIRNLSKIQFAIVIVKIKHTPATAMRQFMLYAYIFQSPYS